MRVLNAEDVRKALPMAAAIEAVKQAFAALSDGRAVVPMRAHMPVDKHHGVTLVMPAFVADPAGDALAVKVVSLFDGNPARRLARIQAAVVAFEPDTGRPVALLEGATLTAIRTGAASGVATDLLARPRSRSVAVFGAGVQARTQLEAVCTVRRIRTAWVFDPQPGAAEAFAKDVAGHKPIPDDVRPAATSAEALAEADIVCTATTSQTPVFADADLREGAHVNAVGSYQPHVQEIPPETIVRARLIVDNREAALKETGDLIQPIRKGLITADHIRADLGELILGRRIGRKSDDQITLFKSVGVAVQDALAARTALQRAEQLNLGRDVPW
jgi:ornithine cyclodeaminase/alanine dehydrogenase-like protein (mu-crystallin family)